jgi:hypothetical protein
MSCGSENVKFARCSHLSNDISFSFMHKEKKEFPLYALVPAKIRYALIGLTDLLAAASRFSFEAEGHSICG